MLSTRPLPISRLDCGWRFADSISCAGGELSTSLDHYRRRLRWLALGTVAIVVAGTTTGLWLRSTYQKEVAITYEELYRRGYQLAKGEEHDRAIEAYREAIAVLPDDSRTADSYNNLGWSLQKLERYTQARRAYESALRLRPDYTLARNNLKALRRYLE